LNRFQKLALRLSDLPIVRALIEARLIIAKLPRACCLSPRPRYSSSSVIMDSLANAANASNGTRLFCCLTDSPEIPCSKSMDVQSKPRVSAPSRTMASHLMSIENSLIRQLKHIWALHLIIFEHFRNTFCH